MSGNTVYSNSVGIQATSTLLLRRQHCQQPGVRQQQPGDPGRQHVLQHAIAITNNTVYQSVGEAIKLQNSPSVRLRNNILWVNAGYDLNIDSASQVGFDSDYNVFYNGTDPNAHVGFWGSNQDTLAAWTAASTKDVNSVFGDPLFVNMNGVDNVLGYSTLGPGYDGGRDDNFQLAAHSPAIDRADAWSSTGDRHPGS